MDLPNIASLRAITDSGVTDDAIYVRSYRNPTLTGKPDGADGLFTCDLGDTTSLDNSGTIIVDTIGRRWKRRFNGGVHNVRWFGAWGDNYGYFQGQWHDDYPAFAACMGAVAEFAAANGSTHYSPASGAIYIPGPHAYVLSQPWVHTGVQGLRIFGDCGGTKGSTTSLRLMQGVSGNTFHSSNRWGAIHMSDLNIRAGDQPGCAAVFAEGIMNSKFENMTVEPGRNFGWGVRLHDNIFTCHLDSINIQGNSLECVGIFARSQTQMTSCDVVACGEGIRLAGSGHMIHGGRIEVNGIGIRIGALDDQPAGNGIIPTTHLVHGSSILANGFESNNVAIRVQAASSTTIQDQVIIANQGAGPLNHASDPVHGIIVENGTRLAFRDIIVSGWTTDESIKVLYDSDILFDNVTAANTNTASVAWSLPAVRPRIKLRDCKYT